MTSEEKRAHYPGSFVLLLPLQGLAFINDLVCGQAVHLWVYQRHGIGDGMLSWVLYESELQQNQCNCLL